MINIKTAAAPLLALALGFATQAHASAPTLDYGTVTSNASVGDRVIDVTPDTRYLNLRNGEVVAIHMGDVSFTWVVNVAPNVNAIPLAQIVPAGAPATEAWVYIAPDELYQSN